MGGREGQRSNGRGDKETWRIVRRVEDSASRGTKPEVETQNPSPLNVRKK